MTRGKEGVLEEGFVRQRAAHIGDGRPDASCAVAAAATTPAARAATTTTTTTTTPTGGGAMVRSLAQRRNADADGPLREQLRALLAPRHLYGPVKATMLADGHAVAAGLITAAVLANHIRRVLAPWLGQFLWCHPVQAMRLARGTPHFFIEQQLRSATDAAALGSWLLWTGALAATKALLRHRLLADATTSSTAMTDLQGRGSKANDVGGGSNGGGGGGGGVGGGSGGSPGPRAATRRTAASLSACLTDGCRIIYLTLCLMQVEYAYAEACWAASWIHAATHVLLRGTSAEREFTHRLLMGDYHDDLTGSRHAEGAPGHWRGISLIAGLLLWWLWRVLRPLHRHGVVGVALSGLPIVGGLIGISTAHIIRYSNKYFIWLEMSEMLLTWVWLALGLALVTMWRLCDQ